MSFNQKEQFLIPRGTIWEIITVATQPVGAPASMGYQINIPEGERGLLLGFEIGRDNYGAARAITVDLVTSTFADIIYRLAADSVDNQGIVGPPILSSITETAITVAVLGVPYMPFILVENSAIKVLGASLANAETLTSIVWIATRVFPPTVSIIGAAVTLTTTTLLQV